MQIIVTWDNSVLTSTDEASIEAAVDDVVNYYDTTFTNPITINIDVGWGEVDGQDLGSDDLGESVTTTSDYTYTQIVAALTSTADASGDAAQLAAIQTLASDDPPVNGDFSIADAEAKALGLMSADGTEVDGYVGFDSTPGIWSFSDGVTPPQDEYYFIGVAEHEISEVMGRVSDIGTTRDTYSVMDLFRYSAPGVRDLTAGQSGRRASNTTAYFSIDGGNTNLGTWNNVPADGDLGDWDGPNGPTADDAFNAASSPGVINVVSPTDLTLMNVLGYDLACFMAGTRIRTPNGQIAVELLSRGDLVTVADGSVAPVAWIGRCTVSTRFGDPLRILPIRVKASALGDGIPARDLLLSPDHALLVDGVLVNAGALVNGSSVVREENVPPRFTYYHLELDSHALILAEDAPAETFVDNVDRLVFDNWHEHDALYPEGKSVTELPYPRAKAHRQVPQAVRARLAARAMALAGASCSLVA